jgi:hypothetical protein
MGIRIIAENIPRSTARSFYYTNLLIASKESRKYQ